MHGYGPPGQLVFFDAFCLLGLCHWVKGGTVVSCIIALGITHLVVDML